MKNSQYNSAQLKKAVANLTKELEAKQQQIETLQAELASKIFVSLSWTMLWPV